MRTALLIITALVLTACGFRDEPDLLGPNGNDPGPDEFSILPRKPLVLPDTIGALPDPTPGGSNLSDPTPEADAVVALGGRPGASVGVTGDIVAYARRFGVTPNIRGMLASEDLAFRRRNDARILERWFGTNVYFRAYESQTLDSYAENERMRRAGIRTPSAPPEAAE